MGRWTHVKAAAMAGCAILAAACLAGGAASQAQANNAAASPAADAGPMPTMEIQLDGRATTVRWTLKSLFHTARGTFHLQSGDVVANLKTGLAQGEVTVDAASGSSGPGAGGNAARDARWQKDMLQSATYPAILFHPAKIEGLKAGEGEQEATASGVMTLQGHDHAIEMRLHVVVKGQKVTIASHFTVPYAEWGVKQPSAGLGRYDKQVTIDVEATGTWTLRMARTDKR